MALPLLQAALRAVIGGQLLAASDIFFGVDTTSLGIVAPAEDGVRFAAVVEARDEQEDDRW